MKKEYSHSIKTLSGHFWLISVAACIFMSSLFIALGEETNSNLESKTLRKNILVARRMMDGILSDLEKSDEKNPMEAEKGLKEKFKNEILDD